MKSLVRSSLLLVLTLVCVSTLALRAQTDIHVLTYFAHAPNGTWFSGVIRGKDGNIYGTSYLGGSSKTYTIFKITPGGGLTTLHTFTAQSEAGSLDFQGADGNFYGVTSGDGGGGSKNAGTIFKLSPEGVLTTLFTFTGMIDGNGSDPYDLIQDKDGNFYVIVTIQQPSPPNLQQESIVKITPEGTLTKLMTFANQIYPGNILDCKDGNFYGTTWNDADEPGTITVFKLNTAS